jgi:hypothetical protein
MKGLTLRIGLVALGTVAAALTQAVMIDDFTTGQYNITANSLNPIVEAVRNGSMLGGQRDALLSYTGGPLFVNSTVDGGGVQFFNGSSETSGSLTLQYDGLDGELETDGVQTPGTGLNGNFSGDDRFVFDFRFVDAGLGGSVMVTTTVVASNGTFVFSSFVSNGMNIQHVQMFSSFGAANWGSVQRLEFTFTGPAASDFTLDHIYTTSIPGPAAVIPFAVGLATMARRRRSRR